MGEWNIEAWKSAPYVVAGFLFALQLAKMGLTYLVGRDKIFKEVSEILRENSEMLGKASLALEHAASAGRETTAMLHTVLARVDRLEK